MPLIFGFLRLVRAFHQSILSVQRGRYGSRQPYLESCQMNGPQEVSSSLVVSRGCGAGQLQACEEIHDQMPSFVEVTVIFARLFVRRPRRINRHALSLLSSGSVTQLWGRRLFRQGWFVLVCC